ncbi:MAG: glycosyltransferase family 2 protein [Pseudomonadota bacterium]
MDKISVVIPMYNEYENAQPFIAEVVQSLHNFAEKQIVVVNDGSNDATGSVLNTLTQQYKELTVLHHSSNFGQSSAIVTGVRHAAYPLIATLDGDGQNDPADIKKLVAAYAEAYKETSNHAILIAGMRLKRKDSRLKLMSSKIANAVRKRFLKDETRDTGCGLKLFSKDDFLKLPHFNHLHRFLPALYRRAGGQVTQVEVHHRPRTRGQSKYGVMNRLFVGIYDLFGVAWLMRRSLNPTLTTEVKQ